MNQRFDGFLEHTYKRVIRDPLYGYIPVTYLENRIIDSPVFQRLDRLHQMHSAHLVYPSARYTRKCHSLGAMWIAHRAFCGLMFRQNRKIREVMGPLMFSEPVTKMVDELDDLGELFDLRANEKKRDIEWVLQAVRLAALLHDIGHAPLSHLFEDACRNLEIRFKHAEMSKKVIMEILCLRDNLLDEDMADFVCSILSDAGKGDLENKYFFLHQIVSGPIDCDKLDYLVRDAYHAGTLEYGKLDIDRIIDGLLVKEGALIIDESELGSIMGYFHSAFAMYHAVYFHKTCRSFDLAMLDAFREIEEMIHDILSSPQKFVEWDDYNFLNAVLKSQGNEKAKEIVTCYLERRKIYRRVARGTIDLDIRWMLSGDERGGWKKEFEGKLEALIQALQRTHPDLELNIDLRPRIRYVGISLEEIVKWLEYDVVHSTWERKTKTLRDADLSKYLNLSQLMIPVAVFIHQDDYRELSNEGSIERLREEISGVLKNGIEDIVELYFGRHMRKYMH